MGAIICILFVLGLLVADSRLRMWLLLATVLSVLLAFYRFLRSAEAKEKQRKYLLAAGITGGIYLLVALFAGSTSFTGAVDAQLTQYPLNAIRADRASMMHGDAFHSLIIIVLAAGLLFFYLRKTISAAIAVLGVGLLILVDLWTVNKRFLSNDDFQRRVTENYFQPTPVDQAILRDPDPHYRVINIDNPVNDARTSYFHKSVGGYHGAKFQRYQHVIEQPLSRGNTEGFNMFNTRYIITAPQPAEPVPVTKRK